MVKGPTVASSQPLSSPSNCPLKSVSRYSKFRPISFATSCHNSTLIPVHDPSGSCITNGGLGVSPTINFCFVTEGAGKGGGSCSTCAFSRLIEEANNQTAARSTSIFTTANDMDRLDRKRCASPEFGTISYQTRHSNHQSSGSQSDRLRAEQVVEPRTSMRCIPVVRLPIHCRCLLFKLAGLVDGVTHYCDQLIKRRPGLFGIRTGSRENRDYPIK